LTFEKPGERIMQVSSCFLKRLRIDLFEPGVDFLEHGKVLVKLTQGNVDPEFVVENLFDVEETVIDESNASDMLFDKRFLFIVRVDPVHVSHHHNITNCFEII
jgi:hypothetical protein